MESRGVETKHLELLKIKVSPILIIITYAFHYESHMNIMFLAVDEYKHEYINMFLFHIRIMNIVDMTAGELE